MKKKAYTRAGEPVTLSPAGSTASTNEKAAALCAVTWCAALATKGGYCPVHAIDLDLHPGAVEGDEIATEDPELFRGSQCDECDGTGESECSTCYGEGECQCSHCDGEHDCGQCEGTGYNICDGCDGTGLVPYTEGGVRYVPVWAEVKTAKAARGKASDDVARWTPAYYEARRKNARGEAT
jgi:hypothetical protein